MVSAGSNAEGAGAFFRTVRFRRTIFASIMTLAGVTGLVLLAIPGSTDRFFSWGLAPATVASLVGGLYVGSAATFGLGLVRTHVASRALCLMSVVFTLPTLIITLVHREVFDFGRWQAWLWLLLFVGAPAFFVILLALGAWRSVGRGPRGPGWTTTILLGVSAGALVASALLLIDPVAAGGWLPFDPPPMGGRFLGVWCAVVAFLLAWSALRPWQEGRVTVTAAALFIGGALVASVRSVGDLDPAKRWPYLGIIVAALSALLLILVVTSTAATGSGEAAGGAES